MDCITNGDNGDNGGGGDVLLLAHGAGAPMDSDFMTVVAEGVASRGVRVVRFEFPYMRERRLTGKKRPPDKQSVLLACWQEIIDQLGGPEKLVIGGKSMGGRMASLLAAELNVRGLVCLGYPFHPSGKPDKLRVEHLNNITVPTLIVQGERDRLGNKEEVHRYNLPSTFQFSWLADGDHDFKPRVRSGYTHQQNLQRAIVAVVDYIGRC